MSRQEYHGKLDHRMVNKILKDHRGELKSQQVHIFNRLRTRIHNLIAGENNVTVFIYLDGIFDLPVEVTNGDGDNELVITIDEGGIEYAWVQTTLWHDFKSFVNRVGRTIKETFEEAFSGGQIEAKSQPKAIKYYELN